MRTGSSRRRATRSSRLLAGFAEAASVRRIPGSPKPSATTRGGEFSLVGATEPRALFAPRSRSAASGQLSYHYKGRPARRLAAAGPSCTSASPVRRAWHQVGSRSAPRPSTQNLGRDPCGRARRARPRAARRGAAGDAEARSLSRSRRAPPCRRSAGARLSGSRAWRASACSGPVRSPGCQPSRSTRMRNRSRRGRPLALEDPARALEALEDAIPQLLEAMASTSVPPHGAASHVEHARAPFHRSRLSVEPCWPARRQVDRPLRSHLPARAPAQPPRRGDQPADDASGKDRGGARAPRRGAPPSRLQRMRMRRSWPTQRARPTRAWVVTFTVGRRLDPGGAPLPVIRPRCRPLARVPRPLRSRPRSSRGGHSQARSGGGSSSVASTRPRPGSLATLVVLFVLARLGLALLLESRADDSMRVAIIFADAVLAPLLFLGRALLYVNQEAGPPLAGDPREERDPDLSDADHADREGRADAAREPRAPASGEQRRGGMGEKVDHHGPRSAGPSS